MTQCDIIDSTVMVLAKGGPGAKLYGGLICEYLVFMHIFICHLQLLLRVREGVFNIYVSIRFVLMNSE